MIVSNLRRLNPRRHAMPAQDGDPGGGKKVSIEHGGA
jgi:hypothetical protein